MNAVEILDSKRFSITLKRLCHELIENHDRFEDSVLIGLQPRGTYLAKRLQEELTEILDGTEIPLGFLDITFHRDDFRRTDKPPVPSTTDIDFSLEGKQVVLVDDVLFTGRTIRAGLDAMLSYGRPSRVELLVLIDRRFSRHLPVQPDYVGDAVDTIVSERVSVEWKETEGSDRVMLFTAKEEHE